MTDNEKTYKEILEKIYQNALENKSWVNFGQSVSRVTVNKNGELKCENIPNQEFYQTRLTGNEAIIKLCEGWIIRCVEKSPIVGQFNVIDVFVKDGKLQAWNTAYCPFVGSHVILPYPWCGDKFDARDLITIHRNWTLLCKP